MSAQLAIAQQAPIANRFTKLDSSGNALPPDATDHVMVHDATTGLCWLVAYASPKELNHKAAEKAAAKVDAGGHSDWRLPTRLELESILDLTKYNPAIDTSVFPGTKSDWHWSASPVAAYPGCAWLVSFNYGYVYNLRRDYHAWVRAVRGPRASQ